MTAATPIYVLHVREGYETRAAHVDAMMARLGLDFEYVLDGDIADLTDDWLAANFTPGMRARQAWILSCTTKHLIAMRRTLEKGAAGALVLEDDIYLSKKFKTVFEATMREMAARDASRPAIISYEDTRLRFVEHSRLQKGRHLYAGDRDRMAGAYYVNAAAARLLLDVAAGEHMSQPIDLEHRRLLDAGQLDYLWCEPTVATQGSFSGAFRSSLTLNRTNLAGIKWWLKRAYRKLLYRLR